MGAAQVPSVGAVPVSGPPWSGRTLSPFPGAPSLEALPRGKVGEQLPTFCAPPSAGPQSLLPLALPSLCHGSSLFSQPLSPPPPSPAVLVHFTDSYCTPCVPSTEGADVTQKILPSWCPLG